MAHDIQAFWRQHWHRGPAAAAERFCHLDEDDVRRALASHGLVASAVVDFESWENRVFGARIDDPPAWLGSDGLIIKFYRAGRWSRNALLDEQAFQHELYDAGVSVVRPLRLSQGALVGEYHGIVFTVSDRVAGERATMEDLTELTEDQVRALGTLIAHVHSVGATQAAAHRPMTDFVAEARGCLEFMIDSGHIPAGIAKQLERGASRLEQHLGALGAPPPTLRIHADLDINNVLWPAGEPVLMDLDDFQNGYAAQDLAMADIVYSVRGRPDLAFVPLTDQTDARDFERHIRHRLGIHRLLLEGYRSVLPWDDAWSEWMHPYWGTRRFFIGAWFCARAHDPVFMQRWGGTFDGAFWDRIVRRLDLQLDYMTGGAS